jgi:hypothetical protein
MEKRNFNLNVAQKQAQASVDGKITTLIGGVIVIFAVVSLAPEIFTELTNLESATGVPAWVPSIMFIVVGFALVLMVMKTFKTK